MKLDPLTKLLAFLRAKPMIGGLEISDSALRFIVWDGKKFNMTGVRLPPDVIVAGQIVDRAQFLGVLKLLHSQILGPKKGRTKINTVVSLSSVGVFTQVFTLPLIEDAGLEKAVQLNIQMISPLDFSEAYSGWQLARRDTENVRLEILSAFVNKTMIDDVASALQEANFLIVAVESRALSLTRLLNDFGVNFDKKQSYVVMSVDGSGLDFMIVRNGRLYFDYFNSWKNVQGSDKEVSVDTFKSAVSKNLHQLVNFYNSHWQEPLTEVILTTVGFREEITKVITEEFGFKVQDFSLNMNQAFPADWFVALGSAVRGLIPRREDNDISLLGIDAQEEFEREQILGFVRFWEVLLPSVTAVFLLAFFISNTYLTTMKQDLDINIVSSDRGSQSEEMKLVESKINAFNRGVTFLSAVLPTLTLKTPLIKGLNDYAIKNSIVITRVASQAASPTISLSGSAKSNDALLAFKSDLASDKIFQNITMEPQNIKVSPSGVDFTMAFERGPKVK